MRIDYILLDAAFLLPLFVLAVRRWRTLLCRHVLYTAIALVVLTVVFDNLMIAAGVMAYDPAHICGLKLGLAPIEDFAYTLAAVVYVAIWWDRGAA